jgi:methylase of polypeptide subunit release factors
MTTHRGPAVDPSDRLPAIASQLAAADVPFVLLRSPGTASGHPDRCLPSTTRAQLELLVPRANARAARRILSTFDWRFELGGRGMWRTVPKVSYLWDDLVGIDLLWGIQSAPFAFRNAKRLERRLWRRSVIAEGGMRLAHPDDLVVFAAVQAARPGRPQKYDGEDLAAFAAGRSDWEAILRSARQVGLRTAVERGLRVAGVLQGGTDPGSLEWRVADVAWRRLRPKRLRGLLLTGTARLGRAITRSRFAGGEFLSGYGVFLPRPISEAIANSTAEAVAGRPRPLVVEVGTGCGAVGLAIADRVPAVEVHAVDTSGRALWWARLNRPLRHLRRVRFHRGSLLGPLPKRVRGRVDAIAANVPYVPAELWGKGWTSSRGAVVGSDEDGLGLYRSLMRQARGFLRPGGRIVFQVGRDQWRGLGQELLDLGYELGEEVAGRRGDVVVWVSWRGGGEREGVPET